MSQAAANASSPTDRRPDPVAPASLAGDSAAAEGTDLLGDARELVRDIQATARMELNLARIGLIRVALLAIAALAVTTALLVAGGAALALALHSWGLGAAVAALLVCAVYAAFLVAIRRHTSLLSFPATRSLLSSLGGESP